MNLLQKAAALVVRRLLLSDPAGWSVAGGDSYAGKAVTPNSALQLATVWACVRLLAETVATLPLGVYERGASGGKAPARDHPLYALLHDQPNADMSACEFWECMIACLCLWGNGYAAKEMVGNRLVALTPLRPEFMKVDRRPDGSLVYKYSGPDGCREFGEDEIFHLKGFGTTGLVGLSPIAFARHSLGNAMAVEEAVGKTFANGLRPTGFFLFDKLLSDPQRDQARKALVEPLQGSANAGRIGILEAGVKWQGISIDPEDAQMLQTRAFQVEEICRWFRVPPFMIGHTEKSTSWGTGLEQQMIGFLTFSLRPYLTRVEQAVKRSLIPAADRRRIFAEFNLEGLLRADSAGRAALYSVFAQNGLSTRDEIRAKENMPPMPGGNILTVQSNLVPLDQLGQAGAAGGGQQVRSALLDWLFGGDLDALIEQRAKSTLIGHNGGPPLEN